MKAPTLRRLRGDLGERAAAKHLRKSGYRILERNYSALGCEIDLIVQSREYLVFVEVKARRLDPNKETTLTKPAAAVDREKQHHIIRAAKCYLAQRSPSGRKVRFDVVEVYLDPNAEHDEVIRIHHIPGAFSA